MLLMGIPQTGEDPQGGLYDTLQGSHLTGFADASLEDGQFGLFLKGPYAQRHPNLAVVAAGAPRHHAVG